MKNKIMKKYITTILAIIFIPSIVFGLSSTIYRYGDNFGIGTTTPQGIFHISSDAPKVYITDTGDYEHFLLSSDGGDFNISSTSDDFLNETSFLEIGAEGILTLGSGITDMIVVDESDITLGSGSESMRIDNNGNVGIGTITPQGLLHINGDAPKVYLTDTGDYKHFLLYSDEGDFNISSTSDDFLNETNFLKIGAEGILTLGSGITDMMVIDETNITLGSGSESMRIDSNGNVGIGTTSPAYKLDVYGNGRFENDLIANNLSGTNTGDNTVSGTLLDLTTGTFSVNEGTLTDTKYCTYETGIGIQCTSEGGSGSSFSSIAGINSYLTGETVASTTSSNANFVNDAGYITQATDNTFTGDNIFTNATSTNMDITGQLRVTNVATSSRFMGNVVIDGNLQVDGGYQGSGMTGLIALAVAAALAAVATATMTFTNKTLGTTQLGEVSLKLDAVLSGDETWSGVTMSGTAGATLAVGDVCFLQTADSKWELVDGILDGTDLGFKLQLGICVLAAAENAATEMLVYGKVRSAAFPAFTVGAPVYLSDTAGDVQVAQPSSANFAIRVVGYAISATDLLFNPSNDYIVHI